MSATSKPKFTFRMKRPSKKVAVILIVVLLLVAATGVGSYYVWQIYKPAEVQDQTSREPGNEQREVFLRQSQDMEIPENASTSDRAGYLTVKASSAYELKEYQEAADLYNQVLRLQGQSKNSDALYGLAQSYEKLGENAKAKEAYEKVMRIYVDLGGSTSTEAYTSIKEKADRL